MSLRRRPLHRTPTGPRPVALPGSRRPCLTPIPPAETGSGGTAVPRRARRGDAMRKRRDQPTWTGRPAVTGPAPRAGARRRRLAAACFAAAILSRRHPGALRWRPRQLGAPGACRRDGADTRRRRRPARHVPRRPDGRPGRGPRPAAQRPARRSSREGGADAGEPDGDADRRRRPPACAQRVPARRGLHVGRAHLPLRDPRSPSRSRCPRRCSARPPCRSTATTAPRGRRLARPGGRGRGEHAASATITRPGRYALLLSRDWKVVDGGWRGPRRVHGRHAAHGHPRPGGEGLRHAPPTRR